MLAKGVQATSEHARSRCSRGDQTPIAACVSCARERSQGVQGGRGEVLQRDVDVQLQGRAGHRLPQVRAPQLAQRTGQRAGHPSRRAWRHVRACCVPHGRLGALFVALWARREIKDKLAPACKKQVFQVQADAAEDYRADAQL